MPIVTTILVALAIVAIPSWKLGLKFLAIFIATFFLASIWDRSQNKAFPGKCLHNLSFDYAARQLWCSAQWPYPRPRRIGIRANRYES